MIETGARIIASPKDQCVSGVRTAVLGREIRGGTEANASVVAGASYSPYSGPSSSRPKKGTKRNAKFPRWSPGRGQPLTPKLGNSRRSSIWPRPGKRTDPAMGSTTIVKVGKGREVGVRCQMPEQVCGDLGKEKTKGPPGASRYNNEGGTFQVG